MIGNYDWLIIILLLFANNIAIIIYYNFIPLVIYQYFCIMWQNAGSTLYFANIGNDWKL